MNPVTNWLNSVIWAIYHYKACHRGLPKVTIYDIIKLIKKKKSSS